MRLQEGVSQKRIAETASYLLDVTLSGERGITPDKDRWMHSSTHDNPLSDARATVARSRRIGDKITRKIECVANEAGQMQRFRTVPFGLLAADTGSFRCCWRSFLRSMAAPSEL